MQRRAEAAMSNVHRLTETPAERRGRLASDEPGEMVFTNSFDAVQAMQARLRKVVTGEHAKKQKDLASVAEVSPTTIGNMVSSKTRRPSFPTMFGSAAALGLDVVFKPGRK